MLNLLKDCMLALDDDPEEDARRDAAGDYTPRPQPSFTLFLVSIWIIPFLVGIALGWGLHNCVS